MRILLLEDDPVLGDIVTDFLAARYEVDHAFDAEAALSRIDGSRYDLYLFDINVPGRSGIELLRALRGEFDTTPAIFITAYEDTAHLTAGFDAGAHDYIKKPFALEELAARIENSKRLFKIDPESTIVIGEKCVYDLQRHSVIREGKMVTLAPKEAAMLEYFLAHPGRTLSSEELMTNLWDFDHLPSDATLRSHIRRLREVIGSERITTVRGVGYRYE